MTLLFDSKEEMRLRMADLEKKLAESEDERCKLEKTCNVLMRAFREEEKIRYKTLNKNYEKFLQDCTVRKRRNDIILKSLCRIEDRSRALFAKTERLKLLKDRYISYLKISNIKDGISSRTWTTLPSSSSTQKTSSEVTPKLIQWKNPLTINSNDLEDVEENLLRNYKTPDATPRNFNVSRGKYNQKQIVDEIGQGSDDDEPLDTQKPTRSFEAQNKLCLGNTRLPSPSGNPPASPVESKKLIETIHQEKAVNYGVFKNNKSNELEVKGLMKISVSRKGNNLSHQESVEKLKTHSFEGEIFDNDNTDERLDPCDKKILEKDDIEQNEKNLVKKQNNSHHVSVPRINHCLMTSSSNICEEKEGGGGGNHHKEMKTESPEENLPSGLDGVDYQNETYPESYYEQPVHHHNHSSIIADVILEEDETEQDVDEEEKNSFDEVQLLTEDKKNNMAEQTELIDKVHDMEEKAIDEVISQEKPSEAKSNDSSEKSGKLVEENLERKRNVRSNLIHFLESDSESFQIEHGDAVSGNEDSDFDFSFH